MKGWHRWVLTLGSVLLLTACGKPTVPEEGSVPDEPLELEELTLELNQTGRTEDELLVLRRELPRLLTQCLAQQDCVVQNLSVTFGPSEAATVQALQEGHVDMAFLPASLLDTDAMTAVIACSDSPALRQDSSEPSEWTENAYQAEGPVGQRTLLCAGQSAYGQSLSEKQSPTWLDWSGAIWAVPEKLSPMLEVWFGQQGHSGDELTHVQVCDSYEQILRLGASGQADVLVLPADVRIDYADAWTVDATRTDAAGRSGFGQTESIWTSLPVLAVTAPDYFEVLAVSTRSERSDDLAEALEQAMLALWQSSEGRSLLEQYGYANMGEVTEEARDAYEWLLQAE